MKEISLKQRSWLRGFHIFFSCAWIGTSMSMVLINLVKAGLVNGDELFAVNSALKLIDDAIIVPAAMGCLITGLLFSVFTKWGFFRFYWVAVKWGVTILLIGFGTFFLGPWLNGMVELSNMDRVNILQNQTYLSYKHLNTYFGIIQSAITISLVFLSVLKPWGKRVEE